MAEKQRFLTITEAAEFLQVSETSLRRWTNSGKLRCFRVGGRSERRFLLEDLLAFMPAASTPSEPQLAETEAEAKAEAPAAAAIVSQKRHICLFFSNPDEQWHMMRDYLVEHLSAGLPVVYIQDSASSEHLLELLHAADLPVHDLIAHGVLRIISTEQVCQLTGQFDPQRMLAFMEATILSARAAAYDRLLITSEMTGWLSNAVGAERWKDYEALLNPLVEKYPNVTVVCQYDLKRFDGPAVLDTLLTHPSVHAPGGRAAGFQSL